MLDQVSDCDRNISVAAVTESTRIKIRAKISATPFCFDRFMLSFSLQSIFTDLIVPLLWPASAARAGDPSGWPCHTPRRRFAERRSATLSSPAEIGRFAGPYSGFAPLKSPQRPLRSNQPQAAEPDKQNKAPHYRSRQGDSAERC